MSTNINRKMNSLRLVEKDIFFGRNILFGGFNCQIRDTYRVKACKNTDGA